MADNLERFDRLPKEQTTTGSQLGNARGITGSNGQQITIEHTNNNNAVISPNTLLPTQGTSNQNRASQSKDQPSLRDRLRVPDESTGLTVGRILFEMLGAGFGATGLGAVGLVLGPAGVAGGIVAGGALGLAAGAGIQRKLWGAGVEEHAEEAFDKLTERAQLTEQDVERWNSLSDDQMRELLHVPSRNPFNLWNGVKGKANRQSIREAVTLVAAKQGYGAAKKERERLIALAKQGGMEDGRALHHLIDQRAPARQKVQEFGRIISNNRALYSQPSFWPPERHLRTHGEYYGARLAIDVVKRLQPGQRITEQDREDLKAAMNVLGDSAKNANDGDPLKDSVGQQMNDQLKKRLTRAIYDQFGKADSPYGLNLYNDDRRKLERAFPENDDHENSAEQLEALENAWSKALMLNNQIGDVVEALAEELAPGQGAPVNLAVHGGHLAPIRENVNELEVSNDDVIEETRNTYAQFAPGTPGYDEILGELGTSASDVDRYAMQQAYDKHLNSTVSVLSDSSQRMQARPMKSIKRTLKRVYEQALNASNSTIK
ncbi:MAG: hypothetical protein AAF637_11970 [Pseudomonadota bacterium]